MRYFKLIVDPIKESYPEEYGFKKGAIYPKKTKFGEKLTVKDFVKEYPNEWEEVFLLTPELMGQVKDLEQRVKEITDKLIPKNFDELKLQLESWGFKVMNESKDDNDKFIVVKYKKEPVKAIPVYSEVAGRRLFVEFELTKEEHYKKGLLDFLAQQAEKYLNEEI